MIPTLHRSFATLERQKLALLSSVSTWSDARLRHRPEPSVWSALDLLDHLVKVEIGTLAALRSNLPNGSPVTLRDRFGALMVNAVMLSPKRIKVPASAAQLVLPEPAAEPSTILERWSELRLDISDLLSSLSPQQLRCGLFRHPVSGWLTVSQALTFLSTHLTHHSRYQLVRLRQATRHLDR